MLRPLLIFLFLSNVIFLQDAYLELPPDQTRPVPGILLGIVTKESSNSILGQEKTKLDLVDFDDNGIFALTDTKTDSNGNIVGYFESF